MVVCEAGWAETLEDLKTDAKLWLLHTGGQTKIVIVICFTETHTKDETDPTSKADPTSETDPPSETDSTNETDPTSKTDPTSEIDPTSEASEGVTGTGGGQVGVRVGERALIKSINESTKQDDLADELLELNEHGELGMPLIGKLQASLYVYCANEDYKDITAVFSTAILPPPPADSVAPCLFQITMKDIFGEDVPKDMKPTDPITFSLPVLREIIADTLPDTAWYRANRRAKKLLKETGLLGECETFAQRKRRRKGGA